MLNVIWVTIISSVLLLTVSGSSLVIRNVNHIGCFPDQQVNGNDYYEVRHILTWEECLQFCHHRLTKYAGVQAEHRLSTDNNCYCGNHLTRSVSTVESTSATCRPCLDHTNRSCGGDDVMSVYSIRDSTPFSVFMATDFGVKLYSEDRPTILTEVGNIPGTTGVKYLYDEEEVFFLTGLKVYRSFFNYMTMSYNNPGKMPLHDYVVLDFTVDWVQKSILWMNGDNDYCIYQADLQGGKVSKLLQRNYFLRNLVIDPYSRMLFFVEFENKLYSYSLEKETLHIYYNSKIHVNKIKKMAVDVQSQMIYVIGSEDEGELQLMAVDYGDSKARQVYQGRQLTDPSALDVYNGEIVWVNHEDLTYRLYRCKLTPRCQPEHIQMARQSLERINEISIYHPEKQSPGAKYLCSQLGCSHSCEAVSLFVVSCSCPPDMILSSDNITCLGVDEPRESDFSITSPLTTHEPDLARKPIQSIVELNKAKPRLLDKRHLIVESENIKQRMASKGSEGYSKTDSDLVGHFQLFVVFCFLTLFLLLSVVIYLQVRRSSDQESAVTVSHRCRAPEPEDGANSYVEILSMPGKHNLSR